MDGGGVLVQEARFGERQAAVFDAHQLSSGASDPLQPASAGAASCGARGVEAGQYKDRGAARGEREVAIDGDVTAVAGADWLAVVRDRAPLKHGGLRQPIRDEQGLGHGGEAEIGELGEQQQSDLTHELSGPKANSGGRCRRHGSGSNDIAEPSLTASTISTWVCRYFTGKAASGAPNLAAISE